MARCSFGVSWRIQLSSPYISCVKKIRYRSSFAVVKSPDRKVKTNKEDVIQSNVSLQGNGDDKFPEWKTFTSKELGIQPAMIAKPIRIVLNRLKKKGCQVYLVGGCVRDLILSRTPKDFDVITSAELKEVRKTFSQCEIVGRRFPICHVHVDDMIVEVSSFSTSARSAGVTFNNNFRRPPGCDEPDYVRWKNCLQRDFTINGLIFDPFTEIVYDYIGGMEDIRKAKVRTIRPANLSFLEDCARILRAARIAARLGFSFTKDLAFSLKDLSSSVLRLDKGRILMEMNYMLAFGSGEATLRLLWRFGLLEILLPIQASYFVSQGFLRRDKRSNMLLSLFSNLDRFVAPDRPCHSTLWIAILAFHKALVDQPRDPLVIAAFSLALHSSGSLVDAVKIAMGISQPHDQTFCELLESQDVDSKEAMIDHVLDLAASVNVTLSKMTDRYYLSKAMREYPRAPSSDLVFISLASSERVCRIFECVRRGMQRGHVHKRGRKIDYESLASGNTTEVRKMLARIIFDTVYPH